MKDTASMLSTLLKIVFLVTLVALPVANHGCTDIKQASLDIHYYTLEYAPLSPEEDTPLPWVLKIDLFQTSPLYDSNRIVFKSREYTRDEYVYHKWRANPGDLTSFFLMRDFSESGLFKATLYTDAASPHTHLLTGVVEQFYQQLNAQNAEAVLTVVITLVDNRKPNNASSVLMQKRYTVRHAAGDMEITGLTKAMSAAMQQVSAAIIHDVYRQLSP